MEEKTRKPLKQKHTETFWWFSKTLMSIEKRNHINHLFNKIHFNFSTAIYVKRNSLRLFFSKSKHVICIHFISHLYMVVGRSLSKILYCLCHLVLQPHRYGNVSEMVSHYLKNGWNNEKKTTKNGESIVNKQKKNESKFHWITNTLTGNGFFHGADFSIKSSTTDAIFAAIWWW